MLQLLVAFCHNAEQDVSHPPKELPLPLLSVVQQPNNQNIEYITHMIVWHIIIRKELKNYLQNAKMKNPCTGQSDGLLTYDYMSLLPWDS